MGCSELGKNTILNEHPVFIFAFITSVLTPSPLFSLGKSQKKIFLLQIISINSYQLERWKFVDTLHFKLLQPLTDIIKKSAKFC